MSIVALKRKTQNTYKCLSGKDPTAILVNRGPGQTTIFSTGGGFSLNGKHRNIGRVGQNSLFSTTGSRMVSGTTNLRGWGGLNGQYYGKSQNNTWKNNLCCVKDKGVKPSTLNTKGMIATKYKWKKTPIPASTFDNNGVPIPVHGQLQTIHNRWTSTETNERKTAQEYIDNKSAVTSVCVKDRNSIGGLIGKNYTCCTKETSNNDGYHIGGKFFPIEPYAKFHEFIGDSTRSLNDAKANSALLLPKGYNKPFPFNSTPDQCAGLIVDQASNLRILNTYYADANNTNSLCAT